MRRRAVGAVPPGGRAVRAVRLTSLRVLLVAQQLRRATPGGIGTYVRGLLAGLGAPGAPEPGPLPRDPVRISHHNARESPSPSLAVSLLASRPPKGDDVLAGLGAPVLASPLPAPLLTRAWHAGLLAAPGGFDVVHAASFNVPRSSAPLTVAVHDLAWRVVPETFPDRGRRWHEEALTRAVRRATRLLVPSAQAAEALLAAGAGAGQVEIVDPMYGCDHLPPPDAAAATDLLTGLGVDGPYLLSVGTLEPRKNLGRLMQAYTRARPSLPEPWPLVIVGPRGWGEALGSPPPAGVVLAGPVPAAVLSALYAGARAVAYVPLHEGYGLPAVEAMACGAPVVATPMPSTGGAALEVDPCDVVAMAACLLEATTDERRRAGLVAAGRARAARLTWAAAAARHVEAWQRLA